MGIQNLDKILFYQIPQEQLIFWRLIHTSLMWDWRMIYSKGYYPFSSKMYMLFIYFTLFQVLGFLGNQICHKIMVSVRKGQGKCFSTPEIRKAPLPSRNSTRNTLSSCFLTLQVQSAPDHSDSLTLLVRFYLPSLSFTIWTQTILDTGPSKFDFLRISWTLLQLPAECTQWSVNITANNSYHDDEHLLSNAMGQAH